MPVQDPENTRAQFLLASILNEILSAFYHFHQKRPEITGRGMEDLAFNAPAWDRLRENLETAIRFIAEGTEINWEKLRDVGLTGEMLEWKADLVYLSVGRTKPAGEEMPQQFQIATADEAQNREEGKPWYKRVWKFAKSLFGSLMEAVKRDSKLRAILDAIKEYIEFVEASMTFLEEVAPA